MVLPWAIPRCLVGEIFINAFPAVSKIAMCRFSVANMDGAYTRVKQETSKNLSLLLFFTEQVGIQYLRDLCPPVKLE